MIAYGWIKEDLIDAINYVNHIYYEANSRFPLIELRDFGIISNKCLRGNQTLGFMIRFKRRAHKVKGSYAPGIAWNYREAYSYYKDKFPLEEFYDREMFHWTEQINVITGTRKKRIVFTYATGVCWHTFGHFMMYLFEKNPNGKIKTGMNSYENKDSYYCKAGCNKTNKYCSCNEYGLQDFFNIREKK